MGNRFGRPLYSIRECYWIIYNGFRSFGRLKKIKDSQNMSHQFMERIMLAVTEVNGCELCLYAHTKKALESGMSAEEIQKMLAGVIDDVPNKEVYGIIFGQHYADTRAKPSLKAWNQINDGYGQELALGVLAVTRVIMLGNALGIPWGSLRKRVKGKADSRSSLGYELAILLSAVIMIPVGGIHAFVARLIGIPEMNIRE
jgi:AhpD family alkylhydroperoxidase